jgi:peptidoglycan-N-acetylglucosamine deacetylase
VKDPASWPWLPSIAVERTRFILRLLDDHKVKATFFMLGWVVERYPEIIRETAAAGHEIACHGHMHVPVWQQTREQFRDDVRRCLDVLRASTDSPIRGYRAPSFSIVPGGEWAFDVIAELGFTYDASLFPGSRGHGGYPSPEEPHTITAPSGARLAELPMSVGRFGPLRMAYSGGGYMRLLPLPLIRRGVRQAHAAGRPVMTYLHPRDFATDCPRVPMPLSRRFKSYVGLATTEPKLRALLREFRWGTCSQVLAAAALADPADLGGRTTAGAAS